jgi:hypothetical protein
MSDIFHAPSNQQIPGPESQPPPPPIPQAEPPITRYPSLPDRAGDAPRGPVEPPFTRPARRARPVTPPTTLPAQTESATTDQPADTNERITGSPSVGEAAGRIAMQSSAGEPPGSDSGDKEVVPTGTDSDRPVRRPDVDQPPTPPTDPGHGGRKPPVIPPKGEGEAADGSPESEQPKPFKIVEIGSGRNPLLTSPNAPDAHRLLSRGGQYVGIDPSISDLEDGANNSLHFVDQYKAPDVEVDARFEAAEIAPGNPLPETLEPNSADRVVISNVFTDPGVASRPELCEAIAEAAATVARKNGEGEIVVIGTNTPDQFPEERARELIQAQGMEYVGSEDPYDYLPASYRDNEDENPLAYASRFRSPLETPNAEAEQAPSPPFTLVEIGGGMDPILSNTEAPDVKRLYQQGGKYVGLDPDATRLAQGQESSRLYVAAHADPDAEIQTEFIQAGVSPDSPLPESLEPNSADRVVISNVFTDPRVSPDARLAIAESARELVRQDTGEVVVVGTLAPVVFPAERVTELFESVGFEHVGSDDIAAYYLPGSDPDIEPNTLVYAERYRPRRSNRSE